MGTARTTLLIVLLCCTVEMNHAVPLPSATAPALPLETEAFTETYTEVVTDTVQSSDTEGAIQESQERPLTGQNDEPSTDTERDDQQSSAQKGDNSDAIHKNDAQGDGPDDLSESDTEIMSEADTETRNDGTLLTSDGDDPEDDDTIVGGNDTHGTPHDAVNTTAQSTESTPKVLSARPLNTSSSSVSTSPMQGAQSDAQHDSASREVETAPQHHNSNPDVVSSTPDGLDPTQHHSESSPAHRITPSMTGLHHRTDSSQGSTSRVPVTSQQHDSSTPDGLNLTPKQTERSEALDHLTPSTSGILHHTTDSVPKIHNGGSVNDEINPPVEAYVTELYTEIMERTELISVTEAESDDTVSAPEEEDSEQRDIISKGEDGSNYTSHDSASPMPMVVSSIPRNTDSTPQSTTYALLHSSAKPLAFADRMDTIPYDAGSSPSIIHSSSVDTDLTSIPFDYLSQASDVTQDEGTSLASAIVPSDTHQAPSSSTDNSIKRKEITPEPMETEIYTEIMQVTELVLSDTEPESEDTLSASDQMGSEQSDDVAAAGSDTSYTPKDYESSIMSVDESQFDDPLSASDQTGSEQSDVSAAQSDISYIQRDYVTALMSAAESESDNTPSASGDDGTEPEQSPEPVATKVYTEMIEVTELPVADATAKSDDTALAPDEDSEVRDNYSNEGHNNDDAPQVSPSSADNRSLFTPDAITSQLTPAPAQERTRETPNTSSTGPRSTRVYVTPNVTRSDTAETSPALTDTDSTPDGHDTTPKDSLNPSTASTESTLSKPRGAPDVVTSTMDIPGDNLAPSQEPSLTEIYTETMEFTEILASNEKD